MAQRLDYIMALDYGEKRVGIALAHTIARLPRPLTTLTNTESLFDEIVTLVAQEQVGLVLVGLPRGMDGGYTAQTHTAEAFQKTLAARLDIPVELADETLSSVDAEAQLQGKKHTKADIDALAACTILERYLVEHEQKRVTL